jgi:hypothetical protein
LAQRDGSDTRLTGVDSRAGDLGLEKEQPRMIGAGLALEHSRRLLEHFDRPRVITAGGEDAGQVVEGDRERWMPVAKGCLLDGQGLLEGRLRAGQIAGTTARGTEVAEGIDQPGMVVAVAQGEQVGTLAKELSGLGVFTCLQGDHGTVDQRRWQLAAIRHAACQAECLYGEGKGRLVVVRRAQDRHPIVEEGDISFRQLTIWPADGVGRRGAETLGCLDLTEVGEHEGEPALGSGDGLVVFAEQTSAQRQSFLEVDARARPQTEIVVDRAGGMEQLGAQGWLVGELATELRRTRLKGLADGEGLAP